MRLLVVVDYQHDFVDGSLGFAEAVALEKPICDKIRAYRENGDDVVYTMDTHEENYLETQEGRKLPVPHCRRGTPGWQLFGEIPVYFIALAVVLLVKKIPYIGKILFP